MSDIAHQTSLIDDDDLFTRPPRSARRQVPPPIEPTTRRQCRACDLTYVVALDYDGPPLCEGCRADVPATRERVKALLDGVDDQEGAAWREWEALCVQHVDHWERIIAARGADPAFADKAARHRAAGNTYGQLLDAEAVYERALAALGAERERLTRALEALWDAEDHSKDEWVI